GGRRPAGRGPSAARGGDLRRAAVAAHRRACSLRGARSSGGRAGTDAVGLTPSRTADAVRDQRIERVEPLVSPRRLLDELPLSDEHIDVVLRGRTQVHAILDSDDDRLLVVVGPCSVHDLDATLDYAGRLAAQAER